MRQSTFLLSIFGSITLAQAASNTTFEFFMPMGADGEDPVAEVLTANPSTTVIRAACPTDLDSTECGWGPGIVYSVVSTTIYKATMSEENLFTMTYSCEHNTKAKTVDCDISMGGDEANSPTTEHIKFTGTEIGFAKATITKGAELLTKGGDETQTTATATAGGQSPGSPSATGSAQVSGSPSGTASGAVPESTGAAYRFGLEGSALLAMAGAAALNAW
jgi:hypothetical protein